MDKLMLIEKIMISRNLSYRNYSRHAAYPVPYEEGRVTLTLTELEILRVIGSSGSISPMDLTYAMGRTKGAISQLLSKLSAKALIAERVDEQDQRKKQCFLTPLGQRVYKEDKERTLKLYGRIADMLESIEAKSLEDYLVINEMMREGIKNYFEFENM